MTQRNARKKCNIHYTESSDFQKRKAPGFEIHFMKPVEWLHYNAMISKTQPVLCVPTAAGG